MQKAKRCTTFLFLVMFVYTGQAKTIPIMKTAEKTMNGKVLTTQILIQAKPEKVWQVLMDFNQYSAWNPFIKSIKGDPNIGNKITAHIEPPESNGMTFRPRVLVFSRNQEFRWLGHLIIPGLFDGEHSFVLVDNGDGTTTFIQSERFRGILIPLFKKMLNHNTRMGFEAMNQKLKERVEHLN